MLVALIVIAAAIYFLPFGGIERIFGYMGLALLVYIAASINLDPDWGEVGRGFVPEVAQRGRLLVLRRRPDRRRADAVRDLLLLERRGRGGVGRRRT